MAMERVSGKHQGYSNPQDGYQVQEIRVKIKLKTCQCGQIYAEDKRVGGVCAENRVG